MKSTLFSTRAIHLATNSFLIMILLLSIGAGKSIVIADSSISAEIVAGASGKTTDAYSPNPISIKKGDTVKWFNGDSQSHTVTSGKSPSDPDSGKEFDSGLDRILFKDDTFAHTFNRTGEFPYFCQLHPSMVGIVIVSEQVDSTNDSNVTDKNEQGHLSDNYTSETDHDYLFGCTRYVPFYHCDPIVNKFESNAVSSKFSKVISLTRDPKFVEGKDGEGIWVDAHALESIRIDNIPSYQSNKFTLMLSINPGIDEAGNRYSNIVTYRNGIFANDWHNAGWEFSFQPNDDPSIRKVRFTVFQADGASVFPGEALVPIEKFTDIAASFDGSNVKFYVNGVLHSQANFTGKYNPDPDQNIKIAGDAYCSCYLTTGTFDNFRLYNRTLSDSEIVLGNSDSGLVGHWKFDRNLNDSTVQKNDAFYNTMLAHMAFSHDGRLFYTEKNSGNIRIIQNNKLIADPFATIPKIHINWEQGLLGLALDNKFDENHYVFVYHNYEDEATGKIFARVVRFTDVNNIGRDMTIVLDRIPASNIGFHTGGALAFNPIDDMLYVTVGDSYVKDLAQDKSSLNGKTLRITRDGQIPPDNPFGSPVYTFGHRNMFGIGFDPLGRGIISEASENLYDEINYLSKGGDYGWPNSQPADTPPELSSGSIKPLRSYFQTLNPTQIVYYSSDKHPELKDSFLVGAFRGYIYSYKIDESGQKLVSELKIDTNEYPSSEVVGVAVSPDGDIYFGFYDIYKIESIDYQKKVQTMFPVQVNSSRIEVSSLSFDKDGEKITAELHDEQGSSSISMKIMNSMIGPLDYELSHEEVNALGDDGKTIVRLPYKVQSIPSDDSSIVYLQLLDDYSVTDNLRLIITGSSISVTKTIPEFPVPLLIFAAFFIVLILVTLVTRIKRSGRSLRDIIGSY